MSLTQVNCAVGDAPVETIAIPGTGLQNTGIVAIAPPDNSVDTNLVTATGNQTVDSLGNGPTWGVTKEVLWVPFDPTGLTTSPQITLVNGPNLILIGSANRTISHNCIGKYRWDPIAQTWTEVNWIDTTTIGGGGSGGGIPEAPTDGQLYGRQSAAWSVVPAVPIASTTVPVMDGTGYAGAAAAYSRGDHVHPSDTTKAPLASPAFTGTPTAPTPTAGTNSTQIATTAFVDSAIGAIAAPPAPSNTTPVMDGVGAAGSSAAYSRGDHIHPSDTTKAPLASPALTGTPTAPTPATTDSSTTLATTAFVKAQGYQIGNQTITLSGDITGAGTTAIPTTLATVNSNVGTYQGITVNGKGLVTGAVNMNYAPLASPTFTGTPAAPTPTVGDNSTALATTAFVDTAIINAAVPAPSGSTPIMDGVGAAGSATAYSRGDHIHPSDTSRLALAGGTMTGPLILAADPTTAFGAATKEYVDASASAGGLPYIGDTPPTGVPANTLWWESDTGVLYIYYNDGDSTQWVIASPQPDTSTFATTSYVSGRLKRTRTVLTISTPSGTYTPPSGCESINVRLVGGGAGGHGNSSGGVPVGLPTAGGTTTFGPLSATGGTIITSVNYAVTAGGSGSGGDINIGGGSGGGGQQLTNAGSGQLTGGSGGASYFGGGGQSQIGSGGGGSGCYGAGGGGASATTTASQVSGSGGAAGGYCEKLITSLAASYSYTVGAGGAGGTGLNQNGGNGGSGLIIIDEYY